MDGGQDVRRPLPFSWKDRRKDVYPLPGGYDGHVDSLLALLALVAERRPTLEDLAGLIQQRFGSSSTNARHIGLFLRRAGFIDEVAGLLEPSGVGELLLEERDDELILAQLHQRARFVGELLAELSTPRTEGELLDIANDRYGMRWTTKAQIQRRRGWLQSLGAITTDAEGRLRLTDRGQQLLAGLRVHPPEGSGPGGGTVVLQPVEPDRAPGEGTPPPGKPPSVDEVEALVRELIDSATDSTSPDRFEYAIAKAFRFLGFRAVKLGGAGKTDVVADADLGRGGSYRVIIDGKTTARDVVGDHQIDWVTIDEHRALHEADYVVVAGPAFSGSRLLHRATDHRVVLMTANDLAALVRQHATMPLDLTQYRDLFEAGAGEVDLESLTEHVEASQRFLEIALAVLRHIEEHVSDVGPLSARDLYLLLRTEPELEASEPEIGAALEALASPLVGALDRLDQRFRPSGNRANCIRRLRLLADALESPDRYTEAD